MSDAGYQIILFPIPDLRHPDLRLLRLDAGLADHIAPALRLFLDESARLSRRAAAGTNAEGPKALQQAWIVHRRIGGGVEFANDLGWGLRRRGQRMPGVGDAAVDSDLLQGGNIRQRWHALFHGDG